MTVSELISKLKLCPPDFTVFNHVEVSGLCDDTDVEMNYVQNVLEVAINVRAKEAIVSSSLYPKGSKYYIGKVTIVK